MKSFKQFILENKKDYVYHVTDDKHFNLNSEHSAKTGGNGAFYVTEEPKVWKSQLNRKYSIKFEINKSKVATKSPSLDELHKFAIKHGYMENRPVKRENGEIVKDFNGNHLIRPEFTEKAKELPYFGNKNNLTGDTSKDSLLYGYLKHHGYGGYQSEYQKDGHEIAIFDHSIINQISKLKKEDKK